MPVRRPNSNKKVKRDLYISRNQKTGKNLRHEFDILIREKHTLVSDDQIDRLWQHIGTQLIQAPNKTLEELIDTLEDISL